MTFGATISRKKALEAAEKAVDKTDELVERHNETIEEVARTRKGLQALDATLTKRMDAQLAMIQGCESTLGRHAKDITDGAARHNDHRTYLIALAKEQRSYVDSQDVALLRTVERFQQQGFVARLRWLFTGHVTAFAVAILLASAPLVAQEKPADAAKVVESPGPDLSAELLQARALIAALENRIKQLETAVQALARRVPAPDAKAVARTAREQYRKFCTDRGLKFDHIEIGGANTEARVVCQ